MKAYEAYHNDPIIKEALIVQLQAHYDADEIIKGTYWENGKGCAVGCAIHSSDHRLYEELFDIPVWLAYLQDKIFECLPNDKAKEFPILFSKSVITGSNLNKIKIPFLIFVVESVVDKFDHAKFPDVKIAVDNVLDLLRNNPTDKEAPDVLGPDALASSTARAAGDAARAAGDAARAAGDAARAAGNAYDARVAWAAGHAWDAAWVAWAAGHAGHDAWVAWAAGHAGNAGDAAWAAWAAGNAGDAAWAAWAAGHAAWVAWAAGHAVDAAWAAWAAGNAYDARVAWAAEAAAYEKLADKLIELIKTCKE